MFTKKKNIIVFFTIFFLAVINCFAVDEYVSVIYKKLDNVFTKKSEDELNSILNDNNDDKNYYLIENYTEKKIRRLILNKDYDFAMSAIIIVIDNNLDNERAVEMYSMIADAYEIQKEYEIEEEERRQKELARIEFEKEKQRDSAEKEYIGTQTVNNQHVYLSGKETKLTSSHWKGMFGLADVLFLTETSKSINTFHYGIAADFRYEYTLPTTIFGIDGFAGFQFVAIGADKTNAVSLTGDVEGVVKFAFPSFSKDFFVRLGYNGMITGISDLAINCSNVLTSFHSPIIGVKMERIPLGKLKLDIGADWLAGQFFYDDIKFAMGGNLNLQIPYANLEQVRLNFNIGIRDKIFVKSSGIENRASLILAIGVENVID